MAELSLSLLDLGSAPPSNAYLTEATLHAPEKWFPLRVLVCQKCWLAQTEDFSRASELFSADYAYFSATSSSWLAHAERSVNAMAERFALNAESFVVEVAANDGYLLQYVKARKIPCMGIEPTASTAAAAREKGIDIVESFFGVGLADELSARGKKADVMVANNVLAHVPDINDFTAGFSRMLKPLGAAAFEFPHLLNLVASGQFDTVYHEHYSYLSLLTIKGIFEDNGLTVFDVEELPTHGGSLRVFACKTDARQHHVKQDSLARIDRVLKKEIDAGINTAAFYQGFQAKAESIKNEFADFLLAAKKQDKKVAAYGAAAKGNTLLNFAGIRPDLLAFVVDRSLSKQGKFLPGSRIPIVSEQRLRVERPDYIVIFPWNIKNEIMTQLSYAAAWGARFVTAVPRLEIA
jgi:SAM-dependent methyltransferase